MRKSLLITTDQSARSDRTVERGFRLASQLDAAVHILHVVQPSEDEGPVRADRRQFFLDEFGPLPEGSEFSVEVGDPAPVIAKVARRLAPAMVLAGVSRLNELLDFILGTTVERLVRECPVPVLVVKRRAMRPYERLLVACDFSDCSREAIEASAGLFPAAALRMVHVYRSPFQVLIEPSRHIASVRNEAEQKLRRFLSSVPQSIRGRIKPALQEGESTATGIAEAARDWRADLVVVGSHGRSGFAEATLGSRANDILHLIPQDILVVRQGSSG